MESQVISPWFLYLWTRLDVFGPSMALVCVMLLMVGGMVLAMATFDPIFPPQVRKPVWRVMLFIMGMLFLCGALPSKKDAAIIYIIPKIVNNPAIQQEAGDLYRIAKEALIEYFPIKKDKSE